MKKTRQGVRDLSDIGPRKSKGVKLDPLPRPVLCGHRNTLEDASGYYVLCKDCGQVVFDILWP